MFTPKIKDSDRDLHRLLKSVKSRNINPMITILQVFLSFSLVALIIYLILPEGLKTYLSIIVHIFTPIN